MTQLENALKVWQGKPTIDANNYHSSTGYLSNSFLSAFNKCQFGALIDSVKAKDEEFNETFATGHLVEAYLFGVEDECLARYGSDALLKSGDQKAWAKKAKELASSIMRHKNIMKLLTSDTAKYHEVITFELYGLPFKSEIDCLDLSKHAEIDIKTTASDFVKKEYNPKTRKYDLTFIDAFNYHRQRALYQFAIYSKFEVKVLPRILAVSKATQSVKLFQFDDQNRLDFELAQIEITCEVFKKVLNGQEPNRCGICETCVEHEIIDYEVLTSSYCGEWK